MNQESPTPSTRRGWLPSISLTIWLALVFGLFLSAQRSELINADGDVFWHRAIGNWILDHHCILRFDPFSHTRPGAPYVTREWLSEVTIALAGRAAGWTGVAWLSAVLIATCFWTLHRQLLAEGSEMVLSTFLVLLAAMACSLHWLARPLLATHFLIVIFHWRLRAFDRGLVAPSRLFVELVPLTILWTNLHGAFFVGIVLMCMYAVGYGFELPAVRDESRRAIRRKIGILCLLALACLAASLVNPNGWGLHRHVLQVARSPFLTRITEEFNSPNFHQGGIRGFLLVLAVLALLLLTGRPRLRPVEIILVGVWGWLSLLSVRNVPLFVLIATPMLAEHWSSVTRNAPDSKVIRWYRNLSDRLKILQRDAAGHFVFALAVVLLLVVLAKPKLWGGESVVPTAVLPTKFPVVAVTFLRTHPDSVEGGMFNDYYWGGYLTFALPERKVFVDGRADFYGEGLLRECVRASTLQPDWESVFEKYQVGWVILPTKSPLISYLALRPGWERVYGDEVAAIYAKRF